MNPTAILGIASLLIETTLTALKLMNKQKSKKKRRNPYPRRSRSYTSNLTSGT